MIEFSSYCRRNCAYCGISLHNRQLKRYRMLHAEILEAVTQAVEKHGFQALVLQSGEDPEFPVMQLTELIREIKKRHQVLILVSFGEVGLAELEILYEAGARGILLHFETANPKKISWMIFYWPESFTRICTASAHLSPTRKLLFPAILRLMG